MENVKHAIGLINNNPVHFLIFDYLDFIEKIRYRRICKKFKLLRITDFHDIDTKYLTKMNDDILKQHKYITKLYASGNAHITDVNNLVNLKKLSASGFNNNDSGIHSLPICGLSNKGIHNINLEVLDASDNKGITKIKHMTNLTKLWINGECGVCQEEINNLNPEELNANNNKNIIKISHMTNLRRLYASRDCGICEEEIKDLKLEYVSSYLNNKIKIHAICPKYTISPWINSCEPDMNLRQLV
jgi:hypothetical protein